MVVNDIGAADEALPDTLDLSPIEIIGDFPGPALLFGGRGAVLAAKVLLRRGRAASLFYVDLDNFKQVNDVHGHKWGDEALIALARLLSDGTRVGDIVARLGGDEFAMWLEETDEAAAKRRAHDLLERSTVLRTYSGSPDYPLGISIGIAVTDPHSEEALTSLIARADSAMYRVKKDKKGSYAFADTTPAKDGG